MSRSKSHDITNVVFAGLGGTGVLTASDIVATAALLAGYDVKKSELHGMSQRGGSVTSDVRYGESVLSPMTPAGEADFLVVLAQDQAEVNRWRMRDGGKLIDPSGIDPAALPTKKSLNVAVVGVLSVETGIPVDCWVLAIRQHLRDDHQAAGLAAFELGRSVASRRQTSPNVESPET